MSYVIKYTPEAELDIEKHKQCGDKKILLKIDQLLNELRENSTVGTGKPERLKHFEIPTWSRRISHKHRLVYRILEKQIVVLVLSFWGHSNDK
ncbi:MAG TPA: Txe/YoeB family addiction module toxin [Porphyromonadaceae bacterium]|jgi:toxin YoeB|nr:Txe/YoeB family addiction module toxin [Porphyromonadaceae bacterium]HBX19844.1 Txe/YoeB family addiction module toxin [Porphyromonadaceae bacterium]